MKSKEKEEAVFNYLVKTTMDTEKIDRAQAEKRLKALFSSGILDNGSPDNPITQILIDNFMATHID